MSKIPTWNAAHQSTVDSAPDRLDITEAEKSEVEDSEQDSPSRVRRLSAVVGNLGRSLSGRASLSASLGNTGHRRMFSLSRKGKETQTTDMGTTSKAPDAASSESYEHRHSTDDSPFINPPSPKMRAMSQSFAGERSIRPGTQPLIQALSALQWSEDTDNDEVPPFNMSAASDSDAESDNDSHTQEPMASSIHTIYRPLARSRRLSVNAGKQARSNYPSISEEISSSEEPFSEMSDSEGAEDFEQLTPRPPDIEPAILRPTLQIEADQRPLSSHPSPVPPSPISPRAPSRAGSMATVRIQRRTKLAEKLRDVFELPAINEVRAEIPCWLLRSVLLQGYMYLTNSYLCFFAHMPSKEDQILKSGSLNKRAHRTKRWIKHWFILKNDALSWYQSSSDPYFPHGILDLRYAMSCEHVGEKSFRLRTNVKTINLTADSVPSRDEWVKAIRKVIFKAQNKGDSVKIAIPYSAILDIDHSSAMDFSESIEVKVLDRDAQDASSIDSYFFSYFHDLPSALDQIRDAVRTHRLSSDVVQAEEVLDTTSVRLLKDGVMKPTETLKQKQHTSSGFRLTSFLKVPGGRASPAQNEAPEEFTNVLHGPSSFVPVTSSPQQPGSLRIGVPLTGSPDSATTPLPSSSSIQQQHTYPPSTVPSTPTQHDGPSSQALWAVSVPSWLKGTKSRIGGVYPGAVLGGVKEIYSATGSSLNPSRWSTLGDMSYSILETPETTVSDEITQKFRTIFAYDDKEQVFGYFPGYIFRLLPVYGRMYISTNFFCFRSSGSLVARTRMALPLRDILTVERSKATRFGHHGLIIIIRGHEELFFEFGAEDRRDAFIILLEKQIEDVKRRLAAGDAHTVSAGAHEAIILEDIPNDGGTIPGPTENMTDSLPAVMFTSASSTFLTFKPQKSLHFTFLTIGSRGDVQPYISLAKGLKADGHRVRIATHGEFKEWIESHDIEYGYVGGDPAELMRICVENGMFTVSFLKESVQKFRGWLDDLLQTSWVACQGTDVVIESPSAMGGYHIAEALGIPYFRAFTMTWSRTRAYPHAFAVPDRKMGGSYNYMSYVMFDQVFWRAAAGQINRWRKNLLELPSTSLDRMEQHKIPFLYNFSPSVVPPPLDWPEWIRITGYWFLDDADVSATKWAPPEDLLKFITNSRATGKKIVYIGFGSIVVPDPKAMTQCVIEAVVQSGVHAILSKGWSDRLQSPGDAAEKVDALPPQIYPISSIPHDWLFKQIDAACHHGGAGTTGASLRAGIPTIIRPFFGDQFFWADRVEALGVGSGVRKLTVESLKEALILATTDQKQVDRAKLLGEQIRKENGVATAVESIYRDLDYARSLVKRRQISDTNNDNLEQEHSTIRRGRSQSVVGRASTDRASSSSSSIRNGAPSEDWSVISDQDERRSSISSSKHGSEGRRSGDGALKRGSLAAAVLSVLPDALSSSSVPRRRAVSPDSEKL